MCLASCGSSPVSRRPLICLGWLTRLTDSKPIRSRVLPWSRLAAQGYTVLLPDHPGSDFSQQRAMLAGDRPPPGPEELRLRPLDVSALLDAVESGRLLKGRVLNTKAVAVVGHSWGATTTLQLSGGVPTERKLKDRCNDLRHPERNLSWVLQCSWLSGINRAGVADQRVKAVVAVSPPLRLLFEPSSSTSLSSKVLLISGTRDWVVPSGPEAISPMRDTKAAQLGHRLVLVNGADHFSLRSFQGEERPALVGPVILGWINEQLAVVGVMIKWIWWMSATSSDIACSSQLILG